MFGWKYQPADALPNIISHYIQLLEYCTITRSDNSIITVLRITTVMSRPLGNI